MDVSLVLGGSGTLDARCVVCRLLLGVGGGRRFCRELLHNGNIGEFLVKLEVLSVEGISLSSPICDNCCYFVDTADKAWAIIADAVKMLKARRNVDGETGAVPAPKDVPLSVAPMQPAVSAYRTEKAAGSDVGANPPPVAVPSTSSSVASSKPSKLQDRKVPPVKVKVQKGKGVIVSGGITMKLASKRKQCPTCLKVFAVYNKASDTKFKRHLSHHKSAEKKMLLMAAAAKSELEKIPNREIGAVESANNETATSSTSASEDDVICRVCGKDFLRKKYRVRHEQKAHPDAEFFKGIHLPFSCDLCHKRFSSEIGRHLHLKFCKAQVEATLMPAPSAAPVPSPASAFSPKKRSKIVKCKICAKNVRQTRLQVHLKTAHNKRLSSDGRRILPAVTHGPRPCPVCGKVISNSPCLAPHLREAHGKVAPTADANPGDEAKPLSISIVECSGAGEDPSESSGTPSKDRRTYNCPVCDLVCYTGYALQNHVTNEHPDHVLDEPHEDTDDEEYPCAEELGVEDVEEKTGGSLNVEDSASDKHSTGSGSFVEGRFPFRCPLCSLSFHKKIERRRHIEETHSDACWCCGELGRLSSEEEQAPGRCDKCFIDVLHVNAHKMYNHKSWYCVMCGIGFAERPSLTKHVERCCRLDSPEQNVRQDCSAVAPEKKNPTSSFGELPIVREDNGLFTCRVCLLKFDAEENCRGHVQHEHYQCVKCSLWLKTNPLFREHLKVCASPRMS